MAPGGPDGVTRPDYAWAAIIESLLTATPLAPTAGEALRPLAAHGVDVAAMERILARVRADWLREGKMAKEGVEDPPLRIISIEGGIGVGKSTVVNALRAARPDLLYIDEPVDAWEEAGLLDAMYKGTIQPGTFQIAALSTRMAPLLKAVREGHRTIVTERCPWSDFEVFTKANLAVGSIELTAYKMAYDALMTAMPTQVYLYNIYLTADVDTLITRMETRARDAERTESDDAKTSRRAYLDRLQEHHDEFFGLDANTLGVRSYIGTRINSELSAEQVAQQVEFALNCIAPPETEPVVEAPAETPAKRVRGGDYDSRDKPTSPSRTALEV